MSIALSLEKLVLYFLHKDLLGNKVHTVALFSVCAVFYLFYPLIGSLADLKYGRYKTVICNLWVFLLGGISLLAITAILLYCDVLAGPSSKNFLLY